MNRISMAPEYYVSEVKNFPTWNTDDERTVKENIIRKAWRGEEGRERQTDRKIGWYCERYGRDGYIDWTKSSKWGDP